MDEVYKKLNYYLNEMCLYLKEKDSFLLDNIYNIWILNDEFNDLIYEYNLDYEVKENHLTFLEVYNLAREIITNIDKNYLPIYDKLITSGELGFRYESKYKNSFFQSITKGKNIQKIINIDREFNYRDVVTLVHEFIHYVSFKDNIIFYSLCEFLAIYFETFAVNYLIQKGIPKEEVDYLKRFRITKQESNRLYHYEIILLTYIKFGNLSNSSFALLKKFYTNMKQEDFEEECKNFYTYLMNLENENKFELQDNPKLLGEILSSELITNNYRYVLGTILAIYALEYGNMKDIIYLNNHLEEFKDQSIIEVCASIGVYLNDPEFNVKALNALSKYLKSLGVSQSR